MMISFHLRATISRSSPPLSTRLRPGQAVACYVALLPKVRTAPPGCIPSSPFSGPETKVTFRNKDSVQFSRNHFHSSPFRTFPSLCALPVPVEVGRGVQYSSGFPAARSIHTVQLQGEPQPRDSGRSLQLQVNHPNDTIRHVRSIYSQPALTGSANNG